MSDSAYAATRLRIGRELVELFLMRSTATSTRSSSPWPLARRIVPSSTEPTRPKSRHRRRRDGEAQHRGDVNGPTTDEGKQTVSRNALKSGVYAQKWLAVTGDEQYMANSLLCELRRQFPAYDLLDELKHEMFVQAYMQRWRFIQAYGGMMDARRG